MGGKTKQSQRTKNNARPSSSSRSAELLSNSVSLEGGLVTTSSGKVLPTLFPSLAMPTLDHELNPEYQVPFKKLTKKDPITRAKALQELCELVNNGNVEDVVATLPSWAIHYKSLTMDTDRKVREYTQLCHGAIVRVCGRRVAPHLKALLPPWLQAQYDEHAPAQANAQNSLNNTFPDSKLPEVLSFCKSEVLSYLVENLIGNTEAIITKRIEDPEERSQQLCRLMTSSLHGLEYLSARLPAPHAAWLWAQLAPLLSAAAFWRLPALHPAPAVRAAWYCLLGRLAARFGAQFGDAHGRQLLAAGVADARQLPAPAAAPLWTCLLQFMHHVQDWHKHLNKQELIVKRILYVLETGGWGDAKQLSTMLLPLLAHLPPDILTKEFYETFFDAIYKGLEKKNILSSKSERQYWITSLADCLRYLSTQENDFVVEVATSVHRTWIEQALATHHSGQTRTNLIKCSATNMTSLVKYWLKQSKEENSEKYDQLLRNFWQNIGSTIVTQIDKCSTDLEEISTLIEGHILLLQTLKSTFLQGTKKQLGIKFDGDRQNTTDDSPVVVPQCDSSTLERYKHNLNELAYKTCYHYLEAAGRKQVANAILTPLITLFVEFDSKELFVSLARQFELSGARALYDKVLRPWLAGDTMRCKAIVDIIFLMIKHLDEEEQTAILDSFKQFTPAVLEWCVSVSVSHPSVRLGACRRWARSAAVGDTARALATRAVAHDDSRAAALLLACLADGPGGEALLSEEAVSSVVSIVSAAIDDVRSGTLEASAQLAARLVTALAGACLQESYAALALRLLRLNVLVPRGGRALSLHTWREARSSWQDGLAALAGRARARALRGAAALLRAELFRDIENVDVKNIEHIVSLCPHLFNQSEDDESDLPGDLGEIITFTQQMFDLGTSETLTLKTHALRYECVTSRLQFLNEEDNVSAQDIITTSNNDDISDDLPKSELVMFLKKFLFRAIYIRTILLHKIATDDDEDEQKTWCNALLTDQYLLSEYFKVIHDYIVVESLYEGYEFSLLRPIIDETKQKVGLLLADIMSATSPVIRDEISLSLYHMACKNGYFWSYAYYWYKNNAHPKRLPDEADENDSDIDLSRFTNFGYYHMLQAKTRSSPDSELPYKTAYRVMLRAWGAAHPQLPPARGGGEEPEPDVIINGYYAAQSTLLYEIDISDAPWKKVVSNVAIMEFLTLMIKTRGWTATAHHWDFATITLCSVLTSLQKSQDIWGSTKVSMFGAAALRLWRAAHEFVARVPLDSERQQPAPHLLQLGAEWADVFAPDTHHSIYTFIVHVLNTAGNGPLGVSRAWLLHELAGAAPQLRWWHAARRPHACSLRALSDCAAGALARLAHPAYKYLASELLLSLTQDLVLHDASTIKTWSERLDEGEGEGEEEKERPQLSLDYFHDTFVQLQEIVEAALNHVVLGEETCELVPLSDSHSMALGWLLLAEVVTDICVLGRGDLLQYYIRVYRERSYAAALLAGALRLLPGAVLALAQAPERARAPPQYAAYFDEHSPFSLYKCGAGAALALGALACRGARGAVAAAGGGGARGWWAAAPPRAARVLQRAVAAYVAPPLVRRQLAQLRRRAAELPDAAVRIAWQAREVACDYTVEDTLVSLQVTLAPAHPLVAPRLAVTAGPAYDTHWLALYLAYQNGTLLNALKMWTQVVSARVERSPQCYICYCRLHPTTGRLPRVPCHQCRNKFHNLCLRKWFSTSNKSNCPLCRAAF